MIKEINTRPLRFAGNVHANTSVIIIDKIQATLNHILDFLNMSLA